jgi:hypothetical protein
MLNDSLAATTASNLQHTVLIVFPVWHSHSHLRSECFLVQEWRCSQGWRFIIGSGLKHNIVLCNYECCGCALWIWLQWPYVYTNSTVGYRPISFHGLMTGVATGSKFVVVFLGGGRMRKERVVWYRIMQVHVSDVRLHSSIYCHQVAFFPNRLSSMPDAVTYFTFVDGDKVNVHFH